MINYKITKLEVIDDINTEMIGSVSDIKIPINYIEVSPNSNVLIRHPSNAGSNIIESIYVLDPNQFYYATLDKSINNEFVVLHPNFIGTGLQIVGVDIENNKVGLINISSQPLTIGVKSFIIQDKNEV